MKMFNSKQVARIVRKALKESRTAYSYMDVHGESKWIKKHVTHQSKARKTCM